MGTATLSVEERKAKNRAAMVAAIAAKRAQRVEVEETGVQFGGHGMRWEKGTTCITCLRQVETFPAEQLPTTSTRHPQCADCLAWTKKVEGSRFAA